MFSRLNLFSDSNSRSRPARFDHDPAKAAALGIAVVLLAVLVVGIVLIVRGLA